MATVSPGLIFAIRFAKSRASVIFSLFTEMMTSPALIPAFSAGPFNGSVTRAPLASFKPIESEISFVTG